MSEATLAKEKISDENYIQVENVNKYYLRGDEKMPILQNVSFSVAKGEMVCIVGASGCGKSTLLRAIAGLDPAYEGVIKVNGQPVVKPEKSRGIVFQEHRLFPWMTVRQNIMYGLSKMDKKTKKQLVDQHINLVRLNGFENSYPRQLSGGMAQRAGIARALVNNPPVLLLDEPFGALDTFTKINMQRELKRIQKESKTTMILVTHDIDEAVFLADKVIVFTSRPGKIEATINVELPETDGNFRDRNSIEFLNVRRRIYDLFFKENK